jgi:hypothetical protein
LLKDGLLLHKLLLFGLTQARRGSFHQLISLVQQNLIVLLNQSVLALMLLVALAASEHLLSD